MSGAGIFNGQITANAPGIIQGQAFNPGGFSPRDLSGLVAWYRADQGVVLTGSNAVSQWQDQSGNGNHASQAATGSQPVFLSVSQNGRPGVQFFNASGSCLDSPTGAVTGSGHGHSMFVAVKINALNPGTFRGWCCWGTGTATNTNSSLALDNVSKVSYGGAGVGPDGSAVASAGNTYVFGKTYDGSNTVGYFNSVQDVTGSDAFNISNTSLSIGRYTNLTNVTSDSTIYEVLFFNRALSSSELNQINLYLNSRWRAY